MTGSELRALRKRARMTQQQFAELLGYHGQTSISRLETSDTVPNRIAKLATALVNENTKVTQ